ncbi:MAG: ATP-binding protein [Metamycoplasmataceae bacterium]
MILTKINNERTIGIVSEVNGVRVQVELHEIIPPFILNDQNFIKTASINSYVKTRIGLTTIFCKVIGEKRSIERNNKLILELKVIAYYENSKISYGIKWLPSVESEVFLLNKKDFDILHQNTSKHNLVIGKNIFHDDYNVTLDINNFIASHVGIFGNTGSGKSYTLSKIYNEWILFYNKNKKNFSVENKILLFDLNNEYGEDSIIEKNIKHTINVNNKATLNNGKIKINYKNFFKKERLEKLLSATESTQKPVLNNAIKLFEEWNKLYILNINDNTQDINDNTQDINDNTQDINEKIQDKIYEEISRSLLNGNSGIINNINIIIGESLNIQTIRNSNNVFIYINGSITDEKSSYYNSKNLTDLKIIIKEKFSETIKNKIEIFDKWDLMLISLWISISIYSENNNESFTLPLLSRAKFKFSYLKNLFLLEDESDFYINFNNKSICVINLNEVDNEWRNLVINIVAEEIIYLKIKERENSISTTNNPDSLKSIINIVIDEAHNVLNPNGDLMNKDTIFTIEKITKEGRKYGLFLTISSQRPSDISETIISQLHNSIIHRIVNENDLKIIKRSISSLDNSASEYIPILGNGECLITGNSINIPLLCKVDELKNKKYKPNSENIKLIN